MVGLVEYGSRALLNAAFGPESTGELDRADPMLDTSDSSMLLLADAAFDARLPERGDAA
ncbi:hypothetical protein ACFYT4_28750 [Streptomyces sp. NPDC004609]|uniref:hypothetical protein n=1 Tax=Streptomyces sp. NPDC004609 TaxID=3364704 RepID=UPI003688699A